MTPSATTTNSPQTVLAAGSPRRRLDAQEGEESSFVVHRGKTVPTLYNVVTGTEGATPRGSRVAAIKERFNMDTKAEERGEDRSSSGPAGVPSNREDRKSGSSFAGRRSRRNSITSEDSHLTIENFGGSQDNLSMFGRNPDKEPVTLQQSGRRPSIDACTPDSIPSAAGTPSTPSGVNYWKRNNERTRSQVLKMKQLLCSFSTASAVMCIGGFPANDSVQFWRKRTRLQLGKNFVDCFLIWNF